MANFFNSVAFYRESAVTNEKNIWNPRLYVIKLYDQAINCALILSHLLNSYFLKRYKKEDILHLH